MCGIAGQYDFVNGSPARPAELRRMADRMFHRGPDGEGFFVDGPLGFAHRRLSIIDLEGGAQPMSTPAGALTVVLNGEISNYLELFDALRKRGACSRSTTRSGTAAFRSPPRSRRCAAWKASTPASISRRSTSS